MKRNLIMLMVVLIGISAANSQTGIWSGNLDVQGNQLPLIFHLDEDNYCMDSPAQGAMSLSIEVCKDDNGSISIYIPLADASFEGKFENNQINGIFKQHGYEFPLTLLPGELKRKRPQTPDKPGPYSTEDVVFSNGDATLKGTLTLPDGFSRETPVLIMITGSGLQNRDEEIFEHKPFAVIADALARSGIATLRYDDRGFGESTGDAVNCTTEDLMYDALAGINLLRQRFDRVGVLGHSEGGTIALMLASDKKTDFIVSLAGMVVSGKETLLKQNRLAFGEAGFVEKTVDDYCRLLTLLFDDDKDFERQFESSDLPQSLKQNLTAVVALMQTPYYRYFVDLDMRGRLSRIDCPVLALNGTKDVQVFYEDNLGALKIGLPDNKFNKIQPADGLNHLFQHCNTGSIIEYGIIEETISPEILDIIIEWINAL